LTSYSEFDKSGKQLEALHIAGRNLLDTVVQIEQDITVAKSTMAKEPELA
jgi:hypothetical protein